MRTSSNLTFSPAPLHTGRHEPAKWWPRSETGLHGWLKRRNEVDIPIRKLAGLSAAGFDGITDQSGASADAYRHRAAVSYRGDALDPQLDNYPSEKPPSGCGQ